MNEKIKFPVIILVRDILFLNRKDSFNTYEFEHYPMCSLIFGSNFTLGKTRVTFHLNLYSTIIIFWTMVFICEETSNVHMHMTSLWRHKLEYTFVVLYYMIIVYAVQLYSPTWCIHLTTNVCRYLLIIFKTVKYLYWAIQEIFHYYFQFDNKSLSVITLAI